MPSFQDGTSENTTPSVASTEFQCQARRLPRTWAHITQQGGEPIAVLSDTTGALEHDNVIAAHDRQNLLAVLLDLVPLDEIGDLVAELEQTLR